MSPRSRLLWVFKGTTLRPNCPADVGLRQASTIAPSWRKACYCALHAPTALDPCPCDESVHARSHLVNRRVRSIFAQVDNELCPPGRCTRCVWEDRPGLDF